MICSEECGVGWLLVQRMATPLREGTWQRIHRILLVGFKYEIRLVHSKASVKGAMWPSEFQSLRIRYSGGVRFRD